MAEMIGKSRVIVLPEEFLLVTIPSEKIDEVKDALKDLDDTFHSVTFAKSEISVVIPVKAWLPLSGQFPEAKIAEGYKLITFENELEWNIVGFLSAITAALAENNISIGVLSTYPRDYIFVKKRDLYPAQQALNDLISSCKNQ